MNHKLPGAIPGVIALVGDEGFLRTETLSEIAKVAKLNLEEIRTFDGELKQWLPVHDELATLSLFETDAVRVAIVSDADDLVSANRAHLEKWCEAPADGSLLILELDALLATTKLHKIIAKKGWLISCTLPPASRGKGLDEAELKKWIAEWAQSRHGLKLKTTQSKLIFDAVGPNCGLLHQELAKLALYASDNGTISDEQIRAHVGTWSTRTMWEIADAILDGKIADALLQLERIFEGGQQAAGVVPQISWSLRRYGHAAQLVLQSRRTGGQMSAEEAVKHCGFWGADLTQAPVRLRRLGVARAAKLLDWLAELDLKVKGSHSQPDRAIFALEELCLRFHG
ncbi:MAG: DNA polymerase III subunit delta [Pirellulales bacterium]